MDVISTFLKSPLRQDKRHLIYIIIWQRYKIGRELLVYKIFKSLYRLKQVERLWNKMLIKLFQKIGFIPTNADLYILTY